MNYVLLFYTIVMCIFDFMLLKLYLEKKKNIAVE